MNRIYKVIWNKTKGCYAVASEIAKQHSHSSANRKRVATLLTVAFLLSGAVGASAGDLTADQKAVYDAVMQKLESEKTHYVSINSKETGANSNENNKGAAGENALAIGAKALANTEKSISIGHNAHIDGSGGNGNHTGTSSVAIGDNALITTNGLDLTSIAIGKNAKVLNGSGKQERVLSFTPGNYKGGCNFFGCDTMPIDADKLAGGIAIGANSYARTASVQIGSHTLVGYKMGGVEITKYTNDNEANIVGMTTIGTNSYNKGAMASMLGAYSIITGNFDGSGGFNSLDYGPQNFGASVVGSLNSIRSKGHGGFAGVANSIVGLGNIAEDSNGTLIFGAGNKISHSKKHIGGFNATMGDAKGVDEVVADLQKGIKESKSGGAVLAIGGGNTADYVEHSQIIGVNNTVKGKSGEISNFNLVDGYENTVENSNHVTVLGSENEITNGEHHVIIGDKRKVVGAKKNVIIGSSTFKKEIKASKAVIVGHEAEVKVDGGVALGYNSIANVDKGVFGYDPISGKALTSEDELRASMGDAEIKKLEDAVTNAKSDLDAKKKDAKEKEETYKTAKTQYDTLPAGALDDATKKALLANIEKLKKEAEDAKKPIEEAQKAYDKAVKAKDGIVFAWKSGLAAVSVGNRETGETRQITGVAAGTEDTDAVNVAQLKKVADAAKSGAFHYVSIKSGANGENSNYNNDGAKQNGGIAVGPNAHAFGRHGSSIGSSAFSIGELSTAIGGHAVAAVEDGITKEKYDALSDEEKKNYVFHFLGESDGDSRHELSLYYKTNFKTYTNEEFKKLSKDEREKLTKEEGYGYFEGEDKWMYSPRALAVGYRAKAIGKATVAIGNMTEATKYQATAIGVKAKASGEYSFAASDNAKASGEGSISIGHHTEAAGQWSTAVGSWAEAKGQYGIAAGVEATANKKNTSAFGFRAKATTSESTAIGNSSQVTGNGGVSIGYVAKTESDYGVALGAYSVANRERHAVGYLADGETNATWKASMGAVSVGDEKEGYTRQITGLAAGTEDTDAVNVAQLKKLAKSIEKDTNTTYTLSGADNKDGTTTLTLTGSDGKKQEVKVASKEAVKNYVDAHQTTVAGDNVTGVKVAATTEKDKGTTYKVSLEEKVKVGNISINGKKEGEKLQGTITGLTNKTWDPEKIVSGRAATEDQLKLATAKMETFVQDFHPTSVAEGTNISVKKGNATAGGDEYTVSLAKNLKGLSSVETQIIKVGDKEKPDTVTINKTGLRIKGGPNITTAGIDADNKKIIKVADGENPTDAVNMKQLGEVKKGVDTNTRAISSLDTRMNKFMAGAAALAALHPLDFDPDEKLDLAAGYGNYNGAHAAALGAYYRPNEDTMISVGASLGGGENMVNAGVSVKLGQGNHVSTSRVAMAKEMLAMKDHILQLEATIAQMKGFMATMTGEDRRTDLFPDVPENHWAYEYIKGLQEKGILEGYPNGRFEGDHYMTRYEFAAMLYRALMKGVKLDARIVTEFAPELGRIRVDVISKDKNGVPDIERVRVNHDFK